MNKKIWAGKVALLFVALLVVSVYATNGNGGTEPIENTTGGEPQINTTPEKPLPTQNITRTASTETICHEDGTCNLVLYSGTRFIFEDDTWKKVEEARSLMNTNIKPVLIEDDPRYKVKVLDFNTTSIELEVSIGDSKETNKDIPLKILNRNDTGDFILNKSENKKLPTLFSKATATFTEKDGFNLGSRIQFGDGSTTIQLQDADTENLEDVRVIKDLPTSNYGTTTTCRVGNSTEQYYTANTFIKFNISHIPLNSQINNANLFFWIYQNESVHANIEVWNVSNQTWAETAITWNTQPTAEAKVSTTTETSDCDDCWINWTVTSWVSVEYDNNNENCSFMLTDQSQTTQSQESLYTKENADTAHRPYLNITYTVLDEIAPDNIGFLVPTPVNDTNLTQNNYFVNVSFHDNLDAPDWCELELTNASGTINYTMNQGANNSEYYFNTSHSIDGMTYFTAYCNDTRNNINNSETRFVDIQLPIVTLYNVSGDTLDLTPGIDFYFIDDEITTSCYLYFDDVAYDVNASVKNNTRTTLTVNETLDWGSYSVYVKCSDATGTGTSSTITIELSDLYFAIENATGDIVWKADDEGNVDAEGTSNIRRNATFQEDVIIEGTLLGGSPVRISGINMTQELTFKENKNASLVFSIQNTNESDNATSVLTALNDVGYSMNIGIGSSTFRIMGTDYSNLTALFSRSRGKTVFANFYNNPFIWFTNPSDDNDPDNLIEVMRADDTGLNVSKNVTAENIWLPTYCFSHTDDTQNITGAGVWLNVSFDDEASLCAHMTHTHTDSTNDTFTIQDDGVYDISYHLTFSDTAPAPSGHAEMRITRNATEIAGSALEEDSSKQYNDFTLSNGIITTLTKDDWIKFQFTADDSTIGMSAHAAYADHRDTGVIKIRRIG